MGKVCLASAQPGEDGDVGEEGGGRSRMLEEAKEEDSRTSAHTGYTYPRRTQPEGLFFPPWASCKWGSDSFVCNVINFVFTLKRKLMKEEGSLWLAIGIIHRTGCLLRLPSELRKNSWHDAAIYFLLFGCRWSPPSLRNEQ